MSLKDQNRRKRQGQLCAAILILILIILLSIFIIWLILRPTKPKFAIQDATVNQFNITSSNTLATSLQVTIYSRNSNDRIGIYYDRLLVYASYLNQQITLTTSIPPTYQAHEDVNILSPFLIGNYDPISPYLSSAISEDMEIGSLLITIKIDGRVRWKVGSWISGRYHLIVSCPAYLSYQTSGIRLQHPSDCTVDV